VKEHLIEFLFEEYKQMCVLDDLSNKGIEMDGLRVNNWDIVISLIGFPKDNSLDYDLQSQNGFPHDPSNGKMIDDELFIRDFLYDPYFDLMETIDKIQTFVVTDKGLKVKEENDERLIKIELGEYVDWLMQEYEKISTK